MDKNQIVVSPSDFEDFGRCARDMGFVDLKAAPARPVDCADQVREWMAKGFHAGMTWFARNLDRRLDPRLILDQAESMLVLAVHYHPKPCKLANLKLARYAIGDDYHDVVREKLSHLCLEMKRRYRSGVFRAYVDTGPVLERYWAEKAGLGWIGKNGCLMVPKAGSFVFLASIVTNLIFPFGKRMKSACGTCRACLDACPAQAIVSPAVVDSRRCVSYLNIEHRGAFMPESDLSGWVFGCDLCQEVCPWNIKFAPASPCAQFQPRERYGALNASDLLHMTQTEFSEIFRKSAIKRAKIEGLRRNVRHILDREPS